jgi:hypothetical protein
MATACTRYDEATCNARRGTEQCVWDGRCKSLAGTNQLTLEALQCMFTNPTNTLCQWGLKMSEIGDACGTAKTQSSCIADSACAWNGTCDSSALSPFIALDQLGSPMAKSLIASDQMCTKATSKDACLAVQLPGAGSIGKSGSSPSTTTTTTTTTGSSTTTTGSTTTAGSSKSGAASAALPSLLALVLAALALAAF